MVLSWPCFFVVIHCWLLVRYRLVQASEDWRISIFLRRKVKLLYDFVIYFLSKSLVCNRAISLSLKSMTLQRKPTLMFRRPASLRKTPSRSRLSIRSRRTYCWPIEVVIIGYITRNSRAGQPMIMVQRHVMPSSTFTFEFLFKFSAEKNGATNTENLRQI